MSLAPELKKIRVNPSCLYLDPNNPRLFAHESETIPLGRIMDRGVQSDTEARLDTGDDTFKVKELIESIKTNGYIPEAGGYIFVRKIPGSESYLVLEGNRRLISIGTLLRDNNGFGKDHPDRYATLNPIDVLEIIDDIPEEKLQEKISYLLGTCHQGSHKDWSPFAQARGIYTRYLKVSGQNADNFSYNEDQGRAVASLLSIKEKEVKERLTVYVAMKQLAEQPELKEKNKGGIIDSYYSLIGAAVCSSKAAIIQYLPRDPNSFELEQAAVDRVINLCNFDGTRDRRYRDESGELKSPAMKNPQQWRFLEKILTDEVPEKKEANLVLVEGQGQHPEEVWAQRHAELRKLTWGRWLEEVSGVLDGVRMGGDLDSDEAQSVIREVNQLVSSLGEEEGAQNA